MGLLLAVSPVRAHHAFAAEYDAKKQVRLEGVVTQMEWINPHAWIHIDVTGPDGKVTSWMVEGGSPNILLRRGFNKGSLEKGQKISVDGFQAKDGSESRQRLEHHLSRREEAVPGFFGHRRSGRTASR